MLGYQDNLTALFARLVVNGFANGCINRTCSSNWWDMQIIELIICCAAPRYLYPALLQLGFGIQAVAASTGTLRDALLPSVASNLHPFLHNCTIARAWARSYLDRAGRCQPVSQLPSSPSCCRNLQWR